jgi:hypothetical protein
VAETKLDDAPDLMFVDTALDRGDEDDADVSLSKPFEGTELLLDKVRSSSQEFVGASVEAVELEVDVRP